MRCMLFASSRAIRCVCKGGLLLWLLTSVVHMSSCFPNSRCAVNIVPAGTPVWQVTLPWTFRPSWASNYSAVNGSALYNVKLRCHGVSDCDEESPGGNTFWQRPGPSSRRGCGCNLGVIGQQ
jgi:hypothetical protein